MFLMEESLILQKSKTIFIFLSLFSVQHYAFYDVHCQPVPSHNDKQMTMTQLQRYLHLMAKIEGMNTFTPKRMINLFIQIMWNYCVIEDFFFHRTFKRLLRNSRCFTTPRGCKTFEPNRCFKKRYSEIQFFYLTEKRLFK